jgi:hypothetical protein
VRAGCLDFGEEEIAVRGHFGDDEEGFGWALMPILVYSGLIEGCRKVAGRVLILVRADGGD